MSDLLIVEGYRTQAERPGEEPNAERVRESEEWAARAPDRYLSGYPEMEMDERTALVSQRDFERLSEYSTSLPTGVYFGKCWKRGVGKLRNSDGQTWGQPGRTSAYPNWMRYDEVLVAVRWSLGFYSQCAPPREGYHDINWRELVVA